MSGVAVSRRSLAVLTLSLFAVSPVGCGGNGGSSTTGDVGEAPLTKPQYVRAATALCRRHRRQIVGELDRMGADSPMQRAFEDVVLPGFRAQYEGLRELSIPPGDAHFLHLMQSKFKASLSRGEQSLASFFHIKPSDYSEFAEGTLMTREYGIKGCGSLARSPAALLAKF